MASTARRRHQGQPDATEPDAAEPTVTEEVPPEARVQLVREFFRSGTSTLVTVGLLALASVGGTLAFPYLVGRLVEAAQSGEGLLPAALLMAAAGLGGALAGALSTYLVGRIGERIVLDLRKRTIRHALDMRVPDIRAEGVGNLAARLGPDSFQVKAAVDILPLQIPSAAITLVGTLVIMGLLDVVLLLIALACFALAFGVIGVIMVALKKRYQTLQDGVAELSDVFVAQMQSIVAVKAYGAQEALFRRLARMARKLSRVGVGTTALESLMVPAVTLGQQIALVGVLVGGSARVLNGDLTLPDFVAFLLYLLQLVGPIVMAVSGLATAQAGLVATSRFESVLAKPREEAVDDNGLSRHGSGPPPGPAAGASGVPAVAFEDVRFGYDDRPVLRGVSFTVRDRGLTAIVGPSGAGKSTVFSLVERFYPHESGTVRLFGTPVDSVPVADVRRRIAYVDQQFTLMQGSVRENLSLGRSVTLDDDVIMAALRQVGLDEVVAELPDGLDTVIGAQNDLSGGQRQRLALARAVLSDAPLVLLDEPSSQLDGVNEERLRVCVEHMARDRAVLMIAHRLSTIQRADHIVVMEDGAVVAEGTHAELRRVSAQYGSLASEQLLHAAGHESPEPVTAVRR